MNKYRDKSDFEINLEVAHIVLGAGSYDWSSDVKLVKRYVSDDCGLCRDFNPCNNPADAMPIIIENKISMKPHLHKLGAWECGGVGMYSSIHKNPYRAAMICFLMMKDEEK